MNLSMSVLSEICKLGQHGDCCKNLIYLETWTCGNKKESDKFEPGKHRECPGYLSRGYK